MPYFKSYKLEKPFIGQIHGLTPASGYLQVWRETSFRSKAPNGVQVSEVPLSVAEPFTWHESYEALKARNFERQHPGFAFARDRGHVWHSEKFDYLSSPLVGLFVDSFGLRAQYNCYPAGGIGNNVRHWADYPDPDGLTAFGALAYQQASPLAEEFSLPAFVGELREGLPSLLPAVFLKNTAGWSNRLRGRLKDAKNAGSDYLNVQFGWIPLLNDVISIATALAKATVAMTAMDEIHRFRELPIIDKTSMLEATEQGVYNDIPDMGWLNIPQVKNASSGFSAVRAARKTTIQNFTSRRWFEGNFVKLPKASLGLDAHMDRFEWLISTDLTPADLWQIAPWSWLVDWFIDIGGLIDAFQTGTSNRILSTYAYAMEERRMTTTVLLRDIRSLSGGTVWAGPKDYSCVMSYSSKRRIRANPFGFSLNPSVSLSLGQQLILGALGLTKIK